MANRRGGWNVPFRRPEKPLRQPQASSTAGPDTPPSWWVNIDRSAWPAAVQQHQADLSASVASRWVPLRMLG